jgi:hypothetical protein
MKRATTELQQAEADICHDWLVLMKFGQRDHLEALRSEGLVYMNPQGVFAKLEADAVRTDHFEGTDQIHQPSAIRQLTIEGQIDSAGTRSKIVVTPADLAGPLSIKLSTTHHYNIYCLYGIRRPLPRPAIDERNFEFGDSFILILNTQEFIDRLSGAARAAGFNSQWRPVEYYDPAAYSGDTGVFRKPSTFAYQHEFRFATFPGLIEPLRLRLGDLSDIATPILPLAEINQLVDFSEDAARAAGLR